MRWLLFLICCCAFGHEGEPLRPHDLATAWRFDAGTIVPLLVFALLYWRGRETMRWRVIAFWSGWITLALALVSPLHPLGEALFSAHMVQHEILMVVSAPILVVSQPMATLLRGMPLSWRSPLVRAFTPLHFFVIPFVAWLLHAVVLWGWHAPALFQATLDNEFVHALQHISFFLSALLFWWALLDVRSPAARRRGSAFLYVGTTAVHTSVLGWLLTFSTQVWYPEYAERTIPWGLSALADQQLGGLIMWVPAGVTYLIAGVWLIASWMRESEARAFALRSSALLVALLLAGCNQTQWDTKDAAAILSGGNPDAGKDKIQFYGCPSCHTIPGIHGADGLVGPPLTKIASRVYIGGVLENNPENMKRWLRNPRAVDPLTAMPNMNITDKDARDIAGYLYTLR